MNEVTWITDQELRVTALSRRLRELMGLPAASLGDLPVSNLFPGEDPFQIATIAHEWAREGEPVDFELDWFDAKYHLQVQPLHGIGGAIVGVLGSARPLGTETLSALGSWNVDLRTGKTTWSQGLLALLGLEEQPADATVREFDHPEDAQIVGVTIADAHLKGTGYRCDHRIVRADGQTRFVQVQAHLHFDHHGDAVTLTGSLLDITERKVSDDTVSNFPNRALLEERLAASIARAQRSDRLCALLFLDVDGFKAVNDELGHAAGDELLAAVGSRLQRHVRSNDTVARIGGDEFVIVLDNLANNHEAHELARKILSIFNDPFALAGTRRRMSASIGVSIYPFTASAPAELMNAADAAMHVVKKNGGNSFEPARPQVPSRDARKVHLACVTSSAARHHSALGESGLASG
ncbi:MAG: diguanylate cyclase [Candidatus Eremiobacteraeota bacterium]|nr:diguanylate cyclase [Candidatus Eremiobacteraeota bacterium]